MSELRVALVGCGQIADAHLECLGRIEGARIVAVCDRHVDLARQAAARFDVPHAFDSLGSMLSQTSPHVVHVTAPPHAHFALASQCLDAGAHVYVEKPFTSGLPEARALVAQAEALGLTVCLGEDQLFDPAWLQCRAMIERGDLGEIVHVDAMQGYDVGGSFGSLTADPNHWVHQLSGSLLRNVVPHALARVADFVRDPAPTVRAFWYSTSQAAVCPTELRVLVIGGRTSGSIVFSSATRPIRSVAHVFGTLGSVEVDLDARTVTRSPRAALPGALAKVEVPFRRMLDAAGQVAKNARRLWRFDLHYFEGMRRLIECHHASIRTGSTMPIAHTEALRLTSLLDDVFRECREPDALPAPDTWREQASMLQASA
jgi:predicted dehydrogenase